MKRIILHLFLAISLLACHSSDKNSSSEIANNIDSLMNYSFQKGIFNGVILVSQNNEVTYRNSFGYADFDKKELLVPESSFYLASVSKQFTTMAVMILKERGELSYDDKLSDFFADFPDYADKVTIRHMMTHTSGIPDHYGLNAYKVGLNNDDVFELLVKQEALDFEPGSQFSYSNGGYVLLSMIVEKVSGEPFHEFMKTNIFTPLEMTSTLVYDKSEPTVTNRAIGYNMVGKLDDYEIFTTGAGGIYSNLDDLFKWDQALNSDQLVSPESLNEAYQPYVLSSGDTSNYGFGWVIDQENNWVGHSGSLSGFRTYLRRYPHTGDGFVILTNKGNAVSLRDMSLRLESILANEAFQLPKVRLSNKLAALIESEGADNAIGLAKDLYVQEPDQYVYDEYGINSLGYSYLQNDDIDTALKLFMLNVEYRPNSSDAYDSYAEAHLAKKDTTASIENYILSVKMNPNNQSGIIALESLGVNTNNVLPNIVLSEVQLDAFIGKYELPDLILRIEREGDQLYIHPAGQSKSELFVATESKFFSKVVDAQITFNRDGSGKVVSLTLHQDGDNEAKRIE